MIGADIAQKEEPRSERAVLAHDADQRYRAGEQPVLRGAEQAGEHDEVEGLHYKRKPLAGEQPRSISHQDTLSCTD